GTDVAKFADFMTMLAPPSSPRVDILGAALFGAVGCAGCHTPLLRTGASDIAALDHVLFQPFSDFLLHDMGSLADGIVQGDATGREMRTSPLGGVRFMGTFLHDGRAHTIDEAIRGHDGQASRARDRFIALDSYSRQRLLAFVQAL